jgi:hypothetical protein
VTLAIPWRNKDRIETQHACPHLRRAVRLMLMAAKAMKLSAGTRCTDAAFAKGSEHDARALYNEGVTCQRAARAAGYAQALAGNNGC